ncbi:MAG TPA: acetyl-CoA carboxylase biotin carboxyl carrier protein [Candidatus Binataceae bacterium]|nr:acetyl-CoA carboxylase biotin carboxyl carrier protein [Candidatus Binataceae bacterium]
MELRELKALLGLMKDFGLSELEIEDKKGKVRLVRASNAADDGPATPAAGKRALVRAIPAGGRAVGANAPAAAAAAAPTSELAPGHRYVQSPMVGTFYRAASPDSDPFVEEGDSVRKGQALCIIEAMKMMNEIEAEVAGKIVRILCDNGQPVEYGQPLMIIEAG